jgi:hypothetical protein
MFKYRAKTVDTQAASVNSKCLNSGHTSSISKLKMFKHRAKTVDTQAASVNSKCLNSGHTSSISKLNIFTPTDRNKIRH